jgi:TrmH family RNA methyltransferase
LRNECTEAGFCLAEGLHLLEEALASDCEIGAILASESAAPEAARAAAGQEITVVPDGVFRTLATTETTQGILTLIRFRPSTLEALFAGEALVIIIDGVQDPGNAGTIARAAEAFGASGVVFLKGSASPFHPKTIRASAGSLFRVPFVHGPESIDTAVPLYAAMPRAARTVAETDLKQPCGIIIGSEGRGVSERFRARAVGFRIPTNRVESLNAAAAAAVILYEARRQRC